VKGRANWAAIVELYDALVVLTGSPVAEVNRALALAEVEGAAAGLDALPKLEADARLKEYQPYWAARADLLARTRKKAEARHAYEVAIGLETDPAVKSFLEHRVRALG
jgi:RNA polymerase sigma-70 factor (ECF subfamily)